MIVGCTLLCALPLPALALVMVMPVVALTVATVVCWSKTCPDAPPPV